MTHATRLLGTVPAFALVVLAVLGAPPSIAREAPAVAPLTPGSGLVVRLTARAPRRWFTFDVPAAGTGFALAVAARDHDADVDVFLRRGRPLGMDPQREAELSGRTTSGMEVVRAEGPLAPGRWHVWLELETIQVPTEVDVFLRVTPGEAADVWLPGDRRPLASQRRQGAGWAGRVWLPARRDWPSFTLQGPGLPPRGFREEGEAAPWARPPRLRVTDGSGSEVAGFPLQGIGGATTFDQVDREQDGPILADWSLEPPLPLRGPPAPDGTALVLVQDAPGPEAPAPGLLLGGRTTVRLSGSGDARTIVFEVPTGTRGVVLTATPGSAADVDLFVREGKPGDAYVEDADWYGVGIEEAERVVLMGDRPLRPGLYHAQVELIDDVEDVKVQLSAAPIVDDEGERSWRGMPQRLEPGTWVEGELHAEDGAATWYRVRVPRGARSLGAQLWGASSALDLVLLRPGDGSLAARAVTVRVDERMDYAWGAPLAQDEEVLLGVISRDPYDGAVRYRLAWRPDATVLLPEGLAWPPQLRRRDGGPAPVVQAACVEVTLADGSGGSGACLTPGGLVLTCRHVLEAEEGLPLQEEDIVVAFPVRTDRPPLQAYLARLVVEDEELDLALLELTEDIFGRPLPADLDLPHMPLGDLGSLELGDGVTVYGYPADGSERHRTPLILTRGVVSGLEADAAGVLRWIKTDAWIGSGHSGGVLVDDRQRLIGVPAATLGDLEVLGLAVPVTALPAAWQERIREGLDGAPAPR